VASIAGGAQLQARLIDDILDVSRIVSGKIRLNIQPVDLTDVVKNAVDTVRPAADAKHIRIQTIFDPNAGPISGDPDRLQQVVWNLVSNAVKFTPKQGIVQVRLERINSHVEIVVSDTGIGIAPDFLPYIFERFRQADSSSTRKYGGLGLGLSLVKHLVELHGGTVAVNSAGTGMGSEFIVRLPLTPAPVQEAVRGEAGPDVTTVVKRILVVDDNEDAARSLAALLELEGHHASVANSGETALQIAETEKPELVILDIGMPGMSGLKVAEFLRQRQHDPDPVLVALTGWDQPEDRRQIQEAGFNYHLVKPVEAEALHDVLQTLVPGEVARPGQGP